MSYREHAAPPALAPWLRCTWERRAERAGPVRVLPDGCIDIVWTEGAGTQVVGANTTAFLTELDPGTRVVGARMKPGAAPALIGVTPELVRDERIPIAELWGDNGIAFADALDEHADPLAALSAELLARGAQAAVPEPLVGAAVAALSRPATSIAGLADELGVSDRQLRRRVRAAIGYGPKRFARVMRLERALSAARGGDPLARAALDAGYADQAHFAGDCRALAGVSPRALLAA